MEDTEVYENAISQISGAKHHSKRFMILKLHERRLHCLQKMYRYILKFLADHFDMYVAMGVPLMELTQIFKISFLI